MFERISRHGPAPVDRATRDQLSPARIVVGIDDTVINWPAIRWAVQQARASGSALVLAASSTALPGPSSRTAELDRDHLRERTRQMLEGLGSGLEPQLADVRVQVLDGVPAHALTDFVTGGDLLVVGRRVGHPVLHAFEGSTSIAAVGRSTAPVVVVPDNWSAERQGGPVVAGVVDGRDAPVMETAFRCARASDVDLRVVRSWEPAAHLRSATDIREARDEVQQHMDELLGTWKDRYPTVVARVECRALAPAAALVAAAAGASLLIVGRRTGRRHLGGLSLTSTARAVLHRTPCPVMVLPLPESRPTTSRQGGELLLDDADRPEY